MAACRQYRAVRWFLLPEAELRSRRSRQQISNLLQRRTDCYTKPALRKTATRFDVVQLFEISGNDNDAARDTVYDDFEPVTCYFVKLTVTD